MNFRKPQEFGVTHVTDVTAIEAGTYSKRPQSPIKTKTKAIGFDVSNVTEITDKLRSSACSCGELKVIQPPSSLKTKWLDTEEASRYLGLSPASLRNMASNGQIRYYKLGRRNRYLITDLDDLLVKKGLGRLCR